MEEYDRADPPLRILVVDDSPDHLAIVAATLDDPAHDLLVAKSGASALRIAEATPPDLVLLDVRMPGMNGFEACEKLRALPGLAELPVIFVSGLDHPDDRAAAFQAGGSDFLLKPYPHEELRGRVAAHLATARLRRTLASARHAIVRTHPAGVDPKPLALVGDSAAAKALRAAVERHHEAGTVVLRGALTDGVLDVALALHVRAGTVGPLHVHGSGAPLPTRSEGTVLVEHADRRADAVMSLELAGPGRWLFHASAPDVLAGMADIAVPSLPERREDLKALVTAAAAMEATRFGRDGLAKAAIDELTSRPWPGGLAQLAATVRARVLD
jgi:DNA-binding response OmpR family regulator